MQIIIYAGEKPIHISDKPDEKLKKISLQAGVLIYKDEDNIDVLSLVEKLNDKKNTAAVITGEKFEKLKGLFLTGFEVTEAAGGIVQNEKKDLLFIFRRGKWDLPKGKTETGESPETCAAREIEEETGAKNLSLKRKVGDTYHIYQLNEKYILKISRWFYFTSRGPQELIPQPEEDITEVKWVPTRSIKEPMADTYRTIRDIMTAFFDTP